MRPSRGGRYYTSPASIRIRRQSPVTPVSRPQYHSRAKGTNGLNRATCHVGGKCFLTPAGGCEQESGYISSIRRIHPGVDQRNEWKQFRKSAISRRRRCVDVYSCQVARVARRQPCYFLVPHPPANIPRTTCTVFRGDPVSELGLRPALASRGCVRFYHTP